MSYRISTLAGIAFLGIFLTGSGYAAAKTDSRAKQQFVKEMVRNYKFQHAELNKLLDQAQYQEKIVEAITRPAEAKPWHEYRDIFLTPTRITGGHEFWLQHRETLLRAEQKYGVPAEIIIAILGVETRYGEHTGNYRVLDALYTLAFHYPRRGAFFRKELREFLLLAREENVDPLSIKGSYAGALGEPQFMPSSYRRYAVDFNNDGKRDLMNNTADAIGSIANYFKKHKWQTGAAITTQAQADSKKLRSLIKLGINPKTPLAKLEQQGIIPRDKNLPPAALGAVIELENTDGPEHWIGLKNFYVITRYNHSPLYAMAVYQLSQQILAARSADKQAN